MTGWNESYDVYKITYVYVPDDRQHSILVLGIDFLEAVENAKAFLLEDSGYILESVVFVGHLVFLKSDLKE